MHGSPISARPVHSRRPASTAGGGIGTRYSFTITEKPP
jgi:hypothetical protein